MVIKESERTIITRGGGVSLLCGTFLLLRGRYQKRMKMEERKKEWLFCGVRIIGLFTLLEFTCMLLVGDGLVAWGDRKSVV